MINRKQAPGGFWCALLLFGLAVAIPRNVAAIETPFGLDSSVDTRKVPSRRHLAKDKKESTVIGTNPLEQQALELFYAATGLALPVWFSDQNHLGDNAYDYCSFHGIHCSSKRQEEDETQPFLIEGISLKNTGLVGTLPDDLFEHLPLLKTINLSSNSLGGSIPQSLMNLRELKHVDLSENKFTGPLPFFSPKKSKLSKLKLQKNRFKGSISPEALCPLQKLKVVDISGNRGLRGSLPECMNDLNDLDTLLLDGVGLTGTIPSALCSSDRPMNGLDPNEFGCDAIACSMGSFEPTIGRQRDAQTPCQPCPSNLVLGALTCSDEPTGSPTNNPTSKPSTLPTAIPSPTPSTLPSWSPTRQTPSPTKRDTASPTMHPTTSKPSVYPTIVASPPPSTVPSWSPTLQTSSPTINPTINTALPTGAPSIESSANPTTIVPSSMPLVETNTTHAPSTDGGQAWDQTMDIEIVLVGIARLLEDDEAKLMERIIKDFLEEQQTLVTILRVALTYQRIGPQLEASHLSLLQRRRNLRFLQSESSWLPTALTMSATVLLGRSVSLEQAVHDLAALWDENIADLDRLARDTFDVSSLFDAPTRSENASTTDVAVTESTPGIHHVGTETLGDSHEPRFTLLLLALALASVAVFSVTVLHVVRCHRNGFKLPERRDATLEGPCPPSSGDNSSSTSTPPGNTNRNGTSENSDERDEVMADIDIRSAFSCWKHWDSFNGAVSEESDSGWNSGSGSGSVQDAYIHVDSSSIANTCSSFRRSKGLLDPYNADDVWSVAPDELLCPSEGDRSEGSSNVPVGGATVLKLQKIISDSVDALAAQDEAGGLLPPANAPVPEADDDIHTSGAT